MTDIQRQVIYAMIERAFAQADWFRLQGGKVIITVPKPTNLDERDIRVSVIVEEHTKI